MQYNDLVELAICLATHGGATIRCANHFSERCVERYWTSSRCRLDRWSQSIQSFSKACERRPNPPDCTDPLWLKQRVQLQEIIASDVLTRVWLGICSAIDQRQNKDQLEPTARSIYIGHMEVRNRALQLLQAPRTMMSSEAECLNRLRCRSERCTDLLIGRLLSLKVGDIADTAYHISRAREFAEDLLHNHQQLSGNVTWTIMASSIQTSVAKRSELHSPNADLNSDIATSIFSCLPADIFDSIGIFKSLWQFRLTQLVDDTTELINEMIQLDNNSINAT